MNLMSNTAASYQMGAGHGSLSTATGLYPVAVDKEPRLETSCTHLLRSCSIAHQIHVVSSPTCFLLPHRLSHACHLHLQPHHRSLPLLTLSSSLFLSPSQTSPLPSPQPGPQPDLLGTSGDYLRIWKVSDGEARLECMLNNVRAGDMAGMFVLRLCARITYNVSTYMGIRKCTHRHNVT